MKAKPKNLIKLFAFLSVKMYYLNRGEIMIKFFRCRHCGKVIVKLVDANVPTICCGEPMEEIVANTTDAATEKHLPVVEKGRCKITVKVGSVPHPMTPEHYINFIVMAKTNGYEIRFLNPGDKPEATFKNDDYTEVYSYCNLHSLWMTKI